eukprot:superscaffoldBa00002897_g15604
MALMAYRAIPLANGHSPAELLMGRRIRTTVPVIPSSLDQAWLDISKLKEEEQNSKQRERKNFNRRHRAYDLPRLKLGDHVWVTDTREKGTVMANADTPRSYVVETSRGKLCRNRSHLVTTQRPAATPSVPSDTTHPDTTVGHHPAEQSHSEPQSPQAERRYPTKSEFPNTSCPPMTRELSSFCCKMIELSKLIPKLEEDLLTISQLSLEVEKSFGGPTPSQDCSLPHFEQQMEIDLYLKCLLQSLDQQLSELCSIY